MANLDLKYKINIPFADKGNRDDIPDTSPDGLVNNTDGLGVKYELEIPAGGEYLERQIINGIFFKVYAAVKELQDLAISAGFPVDMTKALNVLHVENGGTGANNVANARENLGLGNLAVLDTVNTDSIDDGAVTQSKLASSVVGNLPIGFIYIQLRGQSTPDVLFNTTGKWQDISSTYAGEFFRAVGGDSASFGSIQNEGLPNITGETSANAVGKSDFINSYGIGAFLSVVSSGSGSGAGENSYVNSVKFRFNASNSNSIYGASTHVTPYNSAIRIWKKIS